MNKSILSIYCAVLVVLLVAISGTARAQSYIERVSEGHWNIADTDEDIIVVMTGYDDDKNVGFGVSTEDDDIVFVAGYTDFEIAAEKDPLTFIYSGKPQTLDKPDFKITYEQGGVEKTVLEDEFTVSDSKLNIDNNGGGQAEFLLSYTDNINVGTATLMAGDENEINFLIEPKEIGVEWSSPETFVYDGKTHTLTATATDLATQNDECLLTVEGEGINAGKYTAEVVGVSNLNYKLPEDVTRDFEITAAALTVTAKDHTVVYGDDPANGGVIFEGFAEGDDESKLGGELSYGYDYEKNFPIGKYTITPLGLNSENYTIEFLSGVLTVEPKNVDPEITLSQKEFKYDGTAKTPALVSVTFGETDLSGEYSEPEYQNNVKVGTATVTVNSKEGSNYTFSKDVTFTILPIPFEFLAGQRAAIKIPVAVSGLTFSTDNPEIAVELKDGEYVLTTTENVKKGDLGHLISEITDVSVTITDPFENFFDGDKWYNKDVVLTYPENQYNWVLNVLDYPDATISAEGENNVECEILDGLQNIIAADNFSVKIDKTAPVPAAKVKDYEIVMDTAAAKKYFFHSDYDVSVEPSDVLSGTAKIEYSWDGGNFSDYDGVVKIPFGKNTLYVRAEDLAGNVSDVYKAAFNVFEDSKFSLNGKAEITSDTVYYASKTISGVNFSVDLNGNTVGIITDQENNVLDFVVEDNVIKISKEYLETLLPGKNPLLVHVNPLGMSEAWHGTEAADYESQIMTINLDVKYIAKPKDGYSFVSEADPDVKAFCQGDDVVMSISFDERYSDVDYLSVERLGIDKANSDEEIYFRIPLHALKGGYEQMATKYYKNGYEYDGSIIFPSDYPKEYNIKVYDDVLAVDNSGGQFLDGGYKWFMDNSEISGLNSQYVDLTKYINDGGQHVFYASVVNTDGDRFRVCPTDEFIISPLSKRAAAAVKTYPNPAVSRQPVYIELKNFAEEDFSQIEILLYNQLGGLVKKIFGVQETNPVVLPSGFYNGVVVLRGQKVLNFKMVVE